MITRKITGLTIALLVLALFAAACGADNNAPADRASVPAATETPAAETASPSPSPSSSASVEASPSAPETRLFTDSTGTISEIPLHPQRIATTQFVDAMLALGVKPVGAGSWTLGAEYQQGLTDGIAELGNPVSAESLLEVEPDLIIVAEGEAPEVMEKYRKVAPTVTIPFGGDVYRQVRNMGKLLNKEAEAEAWIADLEAKGMAAREQVKGIIGEDEIVTLYWIYGKDTLAIMGARNMGHTIYRLLGLTPPPFIQEKLAADPNFTDFVRDDVSLEMLPEYSGDHLIVNIFDEESRNGMFRHLQDSALWKNLPAVKNGKVYYVNADPWFSYSPLAIAKQLEQIPAIFESTQPQ